MHHTLNTLPSMSNRGLALDWDAFVSFHAKCGYSLPMESPTRPGGGPNPLVGSQNLGKRSSSGHSSGVRGSIQSLQSSPPTNIAIADRLVTSAYGHRLARGQQSSDRDRTAARALWSMHSLWAAMLSDVNPFEEGFQHPSHRAHRCHISLP